MASLIDDGGTNPVSILDPGAGIGSLSTAALTRLVDRGSVTAYEIEQGFHSELRRTLGAHGSGHRIEARDFVGHAVELTATGRSPGFDLAILNPPYKKISTDSVYRTLVRKIGVETSNLYACFLACAVSLCRPGAQVIAIVPRSFMNGPYFKPFRYWLLDRVAVTHIHVFGSRNQAFADDDVLQENVVLRFLVKQPQGTVDVSESEGTIFSNITHRIVPFSEVVTPEDEEKFIHVPSFGSPDTAGLPGQMLRELGLDVRTGPVVDFRLKDHLRQDPEPGSVPLLYATHFVDGILQWPRETRKPNAIMVNDKTRGWLMKNACYVVLKRFTSKEEKRRVVAYLLPKDSLPGEWIGVENHLNVIHRAKQGLDPALACGLCRYLNSQAVDDYFRTFSGHTQVNAADLRRLRYPCLDALRKSGSES